MEGENDRVIIVGIVYFLFSVAHFPERPSLLSSSLQETLLMTSIFNHNIASHQEAILIGSCLSGVYSHSSHSCCVITTKRGV